MDDLLSRQSKASVYTYSHKTSVKQKQTPSKDIVKTKLEGA